MNGKEIFATGCLLAQLVLLVAHVGERVGRPLSTEIVFVDSGAPSSDDPRSLNNEKPGGERFVSLAFVGDIMQHLGQANDDFDHCYDEIRPVLETVDIAIGNLEFPVDPSRPVGPPPDSTQFNGSVEHVRALAAAGFDVLSTANNHMFDQGLSGLHSTNQVLERYGIQSVGSLDKEAEQRPVVVNCRGLRIGFYAYSFRPNSYPDSENKIQYWEREWPIHELNFFDWTDEYRAKGLNLIERHVQVARKTGVDWLVALVHWGTEWHLRPDPDQQRAGHDFIDQGFDMVIGGHCHVINPIEIYHQRLIAYSLGNLISDFRPLPTRLGAMLCVKLKENSDGHLVVDDFRGVPLLTELPLHRVRFLNEPGGRDRGAWELAQRVLGPACQLRPEAANK